MASLESTNLDADLGSLDADIDAIGQESPVDGVVKDGATSEEASEAELSETLRQFQKNRDAERKLFENTTDSEYWCAICFQSREQKDAFLAATGWDKDGDKYLDGLRIAKLMGIVLPKSEVRFVEEETSKRLVREVGTIEDPKRK